MWKSPWRAITPKSSALRRLRAAAYRFLWPITAPMPSFVQSQGTVESGADGDLRFVSSTLATHPSGERDPETAPAVIPEIAGGDTSRSGLTPSVISSTTNSSRHRCTGTERQSAGLYPPRMSLRHFRIANGVMGSGIWVLPFAPAQKQDTIEIFGMRGQAHLAAFIPIRAARTRGRCTGMADPLPGACQQPLEQTIVDAYTGRDAAQAQLTAARHRG